MRCSLLREAFSGLILHGLHLLLVLLASSASPSQLRPQFLYNNGIKATGCLTSTSCSHGLPHGDPVTVEALPILE